MAISLNEVLAHPEGAAQALSDANTCWRCTVMLEGDALCGFRAVLRPPEPFKSEGFPVEGVWLFVRYTGAVVAVPPEPPGRRRWLHRDQVRRRHGVWLEGPLCLEYPDDPADLRWSWEEHGFEGLLLIVHRHLIYEEEWRRTGKWPVEDAPHGHPREGRHPVRTSEARDLIRRGRG